MDRISDVQKLQQDIENDPIITDQITNLGCLFCVLFFVSVLVAAHTVNNLDLGNDCLATQHERDEGLEVII